MTINEAANLFINKGFRYVKANVSNVYVFLKASANMTMDICLLIDNTKSTFINIDTLGNLCSALERKFIFNGFRNVSSFFMIFSNNVEREKKFLMQPYHFWIFDTSESRLMVFENQPEDYYGLKKDFEELIFSETQTQSKTPRPIITISLIAINIIIFIIMTFSGGTNNSRYLLEYGASYWKAVYENHEYYRLFTCMFLHFNAEHIMNNMITLAFVGTAVETCLGHIHFLCIYIFSGLGASFLSSLYYMHNSPNVITVSAGASGAIFGILGALIIIALMSKSKRRTLKPMNILLIAVLSISNGYLSSSIDNVAHIGGLLFGIILTFLSCLYRKNILK